MAMEEPLQNAAIRTTHAGNDCIQIGNELESIKLSHRKLLYCIAGICPGRILPTSTHLNRTNRPKATEPANQNAGTTPSIKAKRPWTPSPAPSALQTAIHTRRARYKSATNTYGCIRSTYVSFSQSTHAWLSSHVLSALSNATAGTPPHASPAGTLQPSGSTDIGRRLAPLPMNTPGSRAHAVFTCTPSASSTGARTSSPSIKIWHWT
mmetsp:Transcript_32333/g.77313  ORF Transcript_32333/g.77313 Transcript_32333/m.77313 type:complete len:208 (-) Transcript_32333:2958-3581(-)